MNYFSLHGSNENGQEIVAETEEVVEQAEEEQWATITIQEYNRLKQLEFEVKELQNTMDEKDSQLEDLRTIIKKEKNRFIDVGKLSQVSVCRITFKPIQIHSVVYEMMIILIFSGTK